MGRNFLHMTILGPSSSRMGDLESLKAIVHHLEQQRCNSRHSLSGTALCVSREACDWLADENGHVVNAAVEAQLKLKVGKVCMFICNESYIQGF